MPTQPYRSPYIADLVDPELRRFCSNYVEGKVYRWPSGSTIPGRFKDSGGLIHWSWDLGMQGIDYREVRDDAADSGTLAHAMFESDLLGKPFPIESEWKREIWEKGSIGFEAYLKWKKLSRLKPIRTEVAHISPVWLFGGTYDAVAVDDEPSLLDWKTGASIYEESLIQVAGAYRHLHEYHNPSERLTGGFHIIRFSKEDGGFTHHWWPELQIAWEAFKRERILYELLKQLKERL